MRIEYSQKKPWIYEKNINPRLFHALKQTPYEDFGTLTKAIPYRSLLPAHRFSPLTGILVT